MIHSDRRWATLCTLVLSIGFIGFAVAESLPAAFPNGVAAGEVTTSSALLWTHTIHTGRVTFTVSTNADFTDIPFESSADAIDPMLPVQVEVTGLIPATTYFYRATDVQRHSASGRFRTAATEGVFHGLRFGVSGDWRGELAPYPAVANVPQRALHFFVALGDTIYADDPSPAVPLPQARTLAEFRAKHNEVYSARLGLNALADLRSSTAIFAVANDHEIANDYAGGAAPSSDARFESNTAAFINETELFQTALQAFQEYNPIRPASYQSPNDSRTHLKPKFYRTQNYGSDARIFVLDTRSFRDAELAPVIHPLDSAGVNRFYAASFDLDPATGQNTPRRTMLGEAQLAELKSDLLQAHLQGTLWKFVMLGEPIQNLGFVGGSDRFDGYARERADLLKFILDHQIRNVVFVSADAHGTVVNNVSYQAGPGQALVPTGAFDIVTGPVAYDRPLGPAAFDVAATLRVLPGLNLLEGLLNYIKVPDRASFDALPLGERDRLFKSIMDVQLTTIGLDAIGLENSDINATLHEGQYVAAHSYGWSEFDIDPVSHTLTVTTFGINPYSTNQIDASILTRAPEVVSRFVVQPKTNAPELPALRITRIGSGVEISWPAIVTPSVLQSRSDGGDGSWTDVIEEPLAAGDRNAVLLMPSGVFKLYRLRAR